jgi:hypothetical protein
MKRIFKCLSWDIFEHALLIGVGCAFGYIFISILVTGGYRAYEPNLFILWEEIIMSVLLIIFGLIRVSKYLRK